ncbi:nucleomorphin [Acrasis kona]|uniref:Nucleomorphin n=1 Tax=Acrasis kona TaxID=1008807 RepID=A0AAW2Z7L7_9EUKA
MTDIVSDINQKICQHFKQFDDFVFCISGTLSVVRRQIVDLIEENGGEFATSINKSVTHLITTKEDFESSEKNRKVKDAIEQEIPCIVEDFIHDSIKANRALGIRKYRINDKGSKKKANFLFDGEHFVLSGSFNEPVHELKDTIMDHGGVVEDKVTDKTTYLVTTNEDWSNPTDDVTDAKDKRLHIVNERFISDSVKENSKKDFHNYRLVFHKRKADDDDGPDKKKAKK